MGKIDEGACLAALEEITRRAEHGGNLLEAAVDAARCRVRLGKSLQRWKKYLGVTVQR